MIQVTGPLDDLRYYDPYPSLAIQEAGVRYYASSGFSGFSSHGLKILLHLQFSRSFRTIIVISSNQIIPEALKLERLINLINTATGETQQMSDPGNQFNSGLISEHSATDSATTAPCQL